MNNQDQRRESLIADLRALIQRMPDVSKERDQQAQLLYKKHGVLWKQNMGIFADLEDEASELITAHVDLRAANPEIDWRTGEFKTERPVKRKGKQPKPEVKQKQRPMVVVWRDSVAESGKQVSIIGKAYALVVGKFMRRDGTCVVNLDQKHIAKLMGCSLQWTRKGQRDLEKSGFLKVTKRCDSRGYRAASQYEAVIPNEDPTETIVSVGSADPRETVHQQPRETMLPSNTKRRELPKKLSLQGRADAARSCGTRASRRERKNKR